MLGYPTPPPSPPHDVPTPKNLRNERFTSSSCGLKKSCQKILSECKIIALRKLWFFFALIDI